MTGVKKSVRVRVSGILLDQDKILLIAHKKNNDVYWLLPGGGVDYGESLLEALEREFIEELNILINVGELVLVSDSIDPSGNRHIVNICFLCSHKKGEFLLGDDERLHDYRFFDKGELGGVKIFPPINNDLLMIMNGEKNKKYIGKLWK